MRGRIDKVIRLAVVFCAMAFLSCEKQSSDCWVCTETRNGYNAGHNSWEECDPVRAADKNGKRWVTYTTINGVQAVTVHTVECKK